jgi:hypothetical protein
VAAFCFLPENFFVDFTIVVQHPLDLKLFSSAQSLLQCSVGEKVRPCCGVVR